MIESMNNERVKYWAKLQDKKYQELENKFIVEGEHLVQEAQNSGKLLEVISLEAQDYGVPNVIVSEAVMKKITSLTNIPRIIGVVERLNVREIKGNALLLDKISDPGNMGTIIRSAVAFGIDTIVIGDDSVSIYNPKVVRATEGLMFHINIIQDNLFEAINELKNKGYTIYTTDVNGGESLEKVNFDGNVAIVMGNEGAGVSEKIRNLADYKLYIKMNSLCESLNVGVATSIILYELAKSN